MTENKSFLDRAAAAATKGLATAIDIGNKAGAVAKDYGSKALDTATDLTKQGMDAAAKGASAVRDELAERQTALALSEEIAKADVLICLSHDGKVRVLKNRWDDTNDVAKAIQRVLAAAG